MKLAEAGSKEMKGGGFFLKTRGMMKMPARGIFKKPISQKSTEMDKYKRPTHQQVFENC